jgi:hypothetical protein
MGMDPVTAMVGGGLVSGGVGAVAGGKQASKTRRAQRENKADFFAVLADAQKKQLAELESGFSEEQAGYQRGLRTIEEGGNRNIERFSGEGAKAIEREGAQAAGGIKAGLAGSGLLNSSVGANLNLGLARSKTNAYASLGSRVAEMRQGLLARRAAGQQGLGALRAHKAAQKSAIFGRGAELAAGFLGGQQFSSQPVDASGFGQMGALLPFLLMQQSGGGSFQPGISAERAEASRYV